MTAQQFDSIEIKKRKAIRVEQLPPRETKPPYKHMTNPKYFFRKRVTSRNCHVCGGEAVVKCYFQLYKCQKIERYCPDCLDKWVAIPNQ